MLFVVHLPPRSGGDQGLCGQPIQSVAMAGPEDEIKVCVDCTSIRTYVDTVDAERPVEEWPEGYDMFGLIEEPEEGFDAAIRDL